MNGPPLIPFFMGRRAATGFIQEISAQLWGMEGKCRYETMRQCETGYVHFLPPKTLRIPLRAKAVG